MVESFGTEVTADKDAEAEASRFSSVWGFVVVFFSFYFTLKVFVFPSSD